MGRDEGSESSSNTTVIIVVVVVVIALFFMKRRGTLSSRGLAARSRVVVVDSLKTEEDGSKYKRVFRHSKKTCPEGYKAPRSIKRALMKAGGWRSQQRGLRVSVPPESVEGKGVHHRGVHSEGHCCCCRHVHVRLWEVE